MTDANAMVEPGDCPKCGSGEVRIHFCDWHHDRYGGQDITTRSYGEDEHIDAICQRCRFRWRLEVLSGGASTVPQPCAPTVNLLVDERKQGTR